MVVRHPRALRTRAVRARLAPLTLRVEIVVPQALPHSPRRKCLFNRRESDVKYVHILFF